MIQGRRRYGYLVAGLILVLVGLFFGAAQLVPAVYRGATYECIVEGPHSASADSPWVVTGDVSFWPLGRSCEWDSALGGGTAMTYSGSEQLTLVVTGLAAGGVVLALSMGTWHRRRRDHLSAWAEDEATS